MVNTELYVLKSRLDELKESMSAIRSKAASICGAIDSDALIPAVVAEELTAAISDYQQKEEQIRAIGDSLSIPIGATISEISESIRTREESLHLDRFRDIVLDYFRLNADAAELKSVLESTKLALIEDFDKVLSLSLIEKAKAANEKKDSTSEDIPAEILDLCEQRKQARKDKNFALADELRDKITAMGYIVEETRQGTVIKKA